MRRAIVVILVAVAAGSLSASAGGFDLAIESASSRVVKLYGIGAGLQAGYGTGTLVSHDGLVVTVLSLLIDARTIHATASDGSKYEADVLYRDPKRQLALLQLKPAARHDEDGQPIEQTGSAMPPFAWFDLDHAGEVATGDWVIAAGNPFKVADGAESMSIMHGVLGARTRLDAQRRTREFPYRGDVLVIDAVTSNPGAPGSAMVNLDGEFLGMIGRVVVSNLTHTHFNYAIPADVLATFLARAKNPDAPSPDEFDSPGVRPLDLGVTLARAGYRRVLPYVERVRLGSPASKAGLRRNDLILSIAGRSVADVDACRDRFAAVRLGEPVELIVRRGQRIQTIRIESEDQP